MQLGLALLRLKAADAEQHVLRASRQAVREFNTTMAVTLHSALGDARAVERNWLAATDSYRQALALAPAACGVSAALADVLVVTGLIADAVTTLRAALAEDHACVQAHQGLARHLPQLGDHATALKHAFASLELRPSDQEYEMTLQKLLNMQRRRNETDPPVESFPSQGSSVGHGNASGAGGQDAGTGGGVGCGASSSWRSPEVPPLLAHSCVRRSNAFLLVNPFEEGCFHDDLRTRKRQSYFSCGQFNNVLASLLHALALSVWRTRIEPTPPKALRPLEPLSLDAVQ